MIKEAVPAPEAGQVLVQSVCTIVDLEPLRAGRTHEIPEGAFLGRVLETSRAENPLPGTFVVGVGPLAEVFPVERESTLPVEGDDGTAPEHLALLPLAAAVLRAVGDADIRVADRVLVSGCGLAADLAGQAARIYAGRVTRVLPADAGSARVDAGGLRDSGGFDVLIDTTADSSVWARSLDLLRDQGRALLLLPPGPQVYPFDFYPAVHRRSLSVLVRRVPAMDERPAAAADAIRTADRLMRQGILAARERLWAVRVGSTSSAGATGDLNEAGGAAGLLCWFDGDSGAS